MRKFLLNIVPTLLVTLFIFAVVYDDFFVLLAVFVLLPLMLFVALTAFMSFIYTLLERYRWRKIVLGLHLLNIVMFFVAFFLTEYKPKSVAYEMEDHYEDNKDDILKLADYAQKAINDSCELSIEYDFFHPYNNSFPDSAECANIGLDDSELQQIKKLIWKAGCKGICLKNKGWAAAYCREKGYTDSCDIQRIESGESIEILYKWVGLGTYLYDIPLHNTPKDVWKRHVESSEYSSIEYNDSVLFLYESGAVGSDLFAGRDEYLEDRKKK